MSSTLDIYVNTSSPSRRSALVSGFSNLSAPPQMEFVVRSPTLLVRIHPMTVSENSRLGVTEDWGNAPVIKFGGKVTATYATSDVVLFFSGDFTKNDDDEDDIFYAAVVTLNTTEFIDAFTGGKTELAIKAEIELDGDTVAQWDAKGLWDVLRGGEGLPVDAAPAYPTAPIAYKLLGGNSDGTAWAFYTTGAAGRDLLAAATDADALTAIGAAPITNPVFTGTITLGSGATTGQIVLNDGVTEEPLSITFENTQLLLAPTGGYLHTLDLTGIGAARTYTFSNASGTLALQPISVSTNTTAIFGQTYDVFASATFTDPTPAEGGYTVRVRNGTATIGGTGYTEGTWWRVYHSGAWATRRVGFTAASAADAFTTIKQAATESATGVVELATTTEVIAGTDTARAVTPAGDRAALTAYVDPVAATRQPLLGLGLSDAATASRRIEFTMGAAGNVVGSALTEAGHAFRVPETTVGGGVGRLIFLYSTVSTATQATANTLSLFLLDNDLIVRQNATGSDEVKITYSGWRTTNSGKWVRLDAVFTANTTAPVIYADGVALTGGSQATGGTQPNWNSGSATVRVTGSNWTAHEFRPGTPINRALTAAEVATMVQTGALLPQDRLGGSMVARYTSSFTATADGWAQNIGNAALTTARDAGPIGGVTDTLVVTNTTGSILSIQLAKSNAARLGSGLLLVDTYVEVGALIGATFIGSGVIGARVDAGSVALSEGVWQSHRLAITANSATAVLLAIFSTDTGSSLRQINAGKRIWFKNITWFDTGALIQPEITPSAQVRDLGPNRIHGIMTAGIRPLSSRDVVNIHATATTSAAYITGSLTNPLFFEPMLIWEVRAKVTNAGATVTIRKDSTTTNTVAAGAVTNANEWTTLALTAANLEMISGTSLSTQVSAGTAEILIVPVRR